MTETVVTVEQGRPQNTGPPPPKPDGQQQPQDPLSWIAYNMAYFQTIPGILKLIQLVSSYELRLSAKIEIVFEIEPVPLIAGEFSLRSLSASSC